MCFCVKSFPEVHSLRKPLKTEEDKYLLLKTMGTILLTFANMIRIFLLCNRVYRSFTIFWSRRCPPINLQAARNCHQPTFRPHCHRVHLATPLRHILPFCPTTAPIHSTNYLPPPFPNPKLPLYSHSVQAGNNRCGVCHWMLLIVDFPWCCIGAQEWASKGWLSGCWCRGSFWNGASKRRFRNGAIGLSAGLQKRGNLTKRVR